MATGMIPLGVLVADKVTNFTGIAAGRAEWITGGPSIYVQPLVNSKGEYPDGKWIDEPRISILGPGVTIIDDRPKARD